MTIALTGSNSFALKQRLNEFVEEFVKKHGELALERIDAEEASAEAILDAVSSLPFLASKKMVILRDLSANPDVRNAKSGPRPERRGKPEKSLIEQIISSAGNTTDLIIYDPQIDKRTSYFKLLKAKTNLEEFNELDSRVLAAWLVEEAKEKGGQLSLSDANFLIERVGVDQSLLANELDKLLIYEPRVDRQNIELLTEPVPQSKIFDLLDAAFGGDKKKAMQLYEEQRAQKVEPQMILAMVAWQLNLLTMIKFGQGKSTSEIAKDLSMNPFPVNKAAGLARKLSEEKLKEMVDEALNIDWKGKTTAIDMDEALKTYIATI